MWVYTPECSDTSACFLRPPIRASFSAAEDLDNFPIEAQGHNVARVSYATSLMKQGVLLSTTEHLLAAIYSCGIDNVYIDIDSIEIPILDGSAEPFMQMLEHAGVRKLRRKRRYLRC